MGEEHGPAAASGRIGIVQVKPPREGERGGFAFVTGRDIEYIHLWNFRYSNVQVFDREFIYGL
jgi:hypothetical protein